MPDDFHEGSKRYARGGTPDDPPDECEYSACEAPVDHCVHFRDPEDYVYYCREHKSMVANFSGRQYARTV